MCLRISQKSKIHKYSTIHRSFFLTEVAMPKTRQLSSNSQKLGKTVISIFLEKNVLIIIVSNVSTYLM